MGWNIDVITLLMCFKTDQNASRRFVAKQEKKRRKIGNVEGPKTKNFQHAIRKRIF